MPSSAQTPTLPEDDEAPPPKQPWWEEPMIQDMDFCLSSSPAPPPAPRLLPSLPHALLWPHPAPHPSHLGAQYLVVIRWWRPLQTQMCCNWPSCRPPLGSQPCCPADWTSDRPPCISHAYCSHGRWPPGSSHHPQRSCHRRSGRRHHSQCGVDTGHLQREPTRDPLTESTGSISDSQPQRLWEVRNES